MSTRPAVLDCARDERFGRQLRSRSRITPSRSFAYEAVAADLIAATRSSIRSRLTSQYLRAESRSLSGSSPCGDSSRSKVFFPGSFAVLCSLRVDLARRHLPRRARRAAPITMFRSLVLLLSNSQPDSETAVTKSLRPICCFNSSGDAKVSRPGRGTFSPGRGATFQKGIRLESKTASTDAVVRSGRPRFLGDLILSLGGRRPARYCVSNARSAADTLGPIPTMPSSTLGPSSAIQRSPRKSN